MKRKFLSLFLVIAIMFGMSMPIRVFAQDATYYIDSKNGNDSNDGLSEGAAFKSLAKVNSMTFQPGDKILLKRGGIWTGQLHPLGSGAEGKEIVIDCYGTGRLPMINGMGLVNAPLYLYNQSYVTARNLELTNNGVDVQVRFGAYVVAEDIGVCKNVTLSGLVIHDVNGTNSSKQNGGIHAYVLGKITPTKFDNLLIEKCSVRRVDRTGILVRSTWANRGGIKGSSGDWVGSTNVRIRNNMVDDIGGDGIYTCNCTAPVLEYNVIKSVHQRLDNETGNLKYAAGIWTFNTDDSIIQYNEAYLTKTQFDGMGYDSDWNCSGAIIQYNYSHDNEGGFALICGNGEPGTVGQYNTGTIIRYNISQYDQTRVFEFAEDPKDTAIYNNTIFQNSWYVKMVAIFYTGDLKPVNTLFSNNIFYSPTEAEYVLKPSENMVFDNNVFYGAHPKSEPADAHKMTFNPFLKYPGSGGIGWNTVGGYKLKPYSPAIDKGTLIANNGGKDYWGNPFVRTPDLGACEYQGVLPPKANGVKVLGKFLKLKYPATCLDEKVPAIALAELAPALKVVYKYDAKKKTATITKGKTKIILKLNSKTATINGQNYTMPASMQMDKVPYAPMQFLAKKLGYKYYYDAVGRVAVIS